MRKKDNTEKKKIITRKRILTAIILYITLGCILPFLRHKTVDESFAQAFDTADYYSETACNERVLSVDENIDALLWRLRLIEEAEEEIIYSSFDLRDDESGKDIMCALYNAAERGVNVKIIVDGVIAGLQLNVSSNFKTLVSHENVEAKKYNPLTIIAPWRNMLRLHDKYIIADDTAYLLGGRNSNDLFLGDYSEKRNIDREILVYRQSESPGTDSMDQLTAYFDEVWQDSVNRDFSGFGFTKGKKEKCRDFFRSRYDDLTSLYPEAFEETDWEGVTMEANSVKLLSNPIPAKNKDPELWYMLHRLMLDGDNVVIQTPYIICGRKMYSDLREIEESTKNFEIITNAVEGGANPWGCADFLNQKNKIRDIGATVYEYLDAESLHTKSILIDDRMSIIGSYNLDMRSTYLDTELMVAVDSTELNEFLTGQHQKDLAKTRCIDTDGAEVLGDDWPDEDMGFLKKAIYTLLRVIILPIRHLL